jgi:hypothetical protein
VLAAPAHAAEHLRFDGRDPYTLFDRHLQTRQLRLQLEEPDQTFRLTRDWERFRAAGDLAIGTQQTYQHGAQSHFHGFAIADAFFSLRILKGLDVTLNLLAFNPSASDGYRASAAVKPGIAVDLSGELFRIAGKPLRFGVTGTDLGVITVGEGLLFEQSELEGVLGWLDYGPATFSYMYGGRSLWGDDDLIRWELSFFERRLRYTFIEWQSKLDLSNPFMPTQTRRTGYYADTSLDLPLPGGFHTGIEYALRLVEVPRSALLLRADWLRRDLGRLEVHVGYQFRFYQRGSGPRSRAPWPSVPFSFPYQEDTYATNPFEYLTVADFAEQWSHTVMLEARLELGAGFELFGNEELWQRFATNFEGGPELRGKTPSGFDLSDQRPSSYYSAGFSYYPWQRAPHRADVMMTNKQVPGNDGQSLVRFAPGRYYVLRFKAVF